MHDREIAKALTEKQIEVLESLLALVPTVKEVARRFDGKVLNKRFDTALSQATDGKAVCWKKTYMDGYEIKLWESTDRYISVPNAANNYANAYYIKQEYIFLADSGWRTTDWLTEDGRIKASELCAAIDKQVGGAVEDLKDLKDQLAHVESYISEYKRIKAERNAFELTTNHLLRSYFDLNF